ncbi:MAG: STAS domain-containing protein [Gammaproteobacteria bacterium]|nr:STAS domain-containing protein [Gammaproteobacteria bacterium]
MIEVKKKRGGVCHITIDGDMTIYTAAEMKQELLSATDKCKRIEMDLSGISELDSAGFQLLLQLKRMGKSDDIEVLLESHSPAVLDVLNLYGMDQYFDDPLVLPSEQ